MRPRGWLGVSLAVAVVAALSLSSSPSRSSGAVARSTTLTVAIPGRFAGCYYYAKDTSASLRALLDLIRPSAFENKPNGELSGAPGPIAQAELVSLTPQKVVYSLDTSYAWSNGAPFNGLDLERWFQEARAQPTSLADGYRKISAFDVSSALDQVTVTFATPYSDWPMLFRDVSERTVGPSCTLSALARQPSLGPYVLRSISANTARLDVNPAWKAQTPGYEHVVITTDAVARAITNRSYVDYRYGIVPFDLMRLTNDGSLNGRISTSNGLLAVEYSPRRATTEQLAVRQFLSYAINRQVVDDQVLGPTTYNSGIAASVLVTQGTLRYPGALGVAPIDQSTASMSSTVPSSIGVDCVACAAPILAAAGYVKRGGVWRSLSGAPLTIRLGVGTAPYDRHVAAYVAGQWRVQGVVVGDVTELSDVAVAHALAKGAIDAGILTIDTAVVPGFTARQFTGTNFGDTFDAGWRSVLVDQWYAAALSTFNPVAAEASYNSIDQYVTTQAWERPLFTQPSIVTWSNDVFGVVESNYLQGMIDQVPSWGYTPPKFK